MARKLAALLSVIPVVLALNNGLAITPQMGWNTWNHFGCSIDQDTIVSAAQATISNGLDKLRYTCECQQHHGSGHHSRRVSSTSFQTSLAMIVWTYYSYTCAILSLRIALGWQANARDPSTGAPVEDPSKFPNGIKAVADQIHSLGLKVRGRRSWSCPRF